MTIAIDVSGQTVLITGPQMVRLAGGLRSVSA